MVSYIVNRICDKGVKDASGTKLGLGKLALVLVIMCARKCDVVGPLREL